MAYIDDYIKRYCVKHEIRREEAEKHAIVKEAAKYYAIEEKKEKERIKLNENNRRIEV